MNRLLKSTFDSSVYQGARVIAVSSGKGGVGKTSLVVNLSLALSRIGKRVIVLDADLGLANVEILMGITPSYTLFDCLYGNKEIREILTPGPWGIDIISGGSGFLELANLNNRQQKKIIDSLILLDDAADFVIIDTGAGISRNVLGFVAAAGEVIVIITPELTSLTDAYTLIKILAKFRIHNRIMLVVNRVANEAEAKVTAKKIEKVANRFLEIQLIHLGSICEDRAVSAAVRNQQPFVVFQPHCGPACSVSLMAQYLIDGKCSVSQRRTFRGFLQKIINFFR